MSECYIIWTVHYVVYSRNIFFQCVEKLNCLIHFFISEQICLDQKWDVVENIGVRVQLKLWQGKTFSGCEIFWYSLDLFQEYCYKTDFSVTVCSARNVWVVCSKENNGLRYENWKSVRLRDNIRNLLFFRGLTWQSTKPTQLIHVVGWCICFKPLLSELAWPLLDKIVG
jgi:hypothetical protein